MKKITTNKYAQISPVSPVSRIPPMRPVGVKTRPGYDDISISEGAKDPGKLREILETQGEAAAEKYLEQQGMTYSNIRAAIRAIKADRF